MPSIDLAHAFKHVIVTLRRSKILYIDIEHAKVRHIHEPHQRGHAARIGYLAPAPLRSQYVWYGDVDFANLTKQRYFAVCISGNTSEWVDYIADTPPLAPLQSWLASEDNLMPIFAVCGGHQLVAKAFGVPVRHMPDGQEESGDYFTVTPENPDHPLFSRLRKPPQFMQYHHDEVEAVHPSFDLLASSPLCRVQAVSHRTRLLVTTQFHPEQDRPEHVPAGDGSQLLKAFFRLCVQYWWNR